jgi:hypothetical protein
MGNRVAIVGVSVGDGYTAKHMTGGRRRDI